MTEFYDQSADYPLAEGGVHEPLDLDLGTERVQRLYGAAVEIALGSMTGSFAGSQVGQYEGILAKAFGADTARYMIMHALMDARDLQYPVVTGKPQ